MMINFTMHLFNSQAPCNFLTFKASEIVSIYHYSTVYNINMSCEMVIIVIYVYCDGTNVCITFFLLSCDLNFFLGNFYHHLSDKVQKCLILFCESSAIPRGQNGVPGEDEAGGN